ncbi:hypothetical protein Hypma_011427 [Hypsizygus marmoreus]|uniref:Uncharacterized protein n=1 Tax=Hypsizygus marmoreus TaxID=39966 RepID=A0A369JMT7_HYPMA|nr:hypothetical protein Hypma_011427 [Hypsizygus marmoreus]
MSRLASFRGPSTPSASPVQIKQLNSPSSPSRSLESTYHRKTRTILQELRSIAETWDDLVLVDGLKAAKSLIDTRTDLDNEIALLPDRQPRVRLVGPKLALMEKRIAELDAVINKLQKQFRRMNAAVEALEAVLIEAHKAKGWKWVHEEPLWVTWSLEKFAISVSGLLKPYHRSLNLHMEIVNTLRNHSVSFEDSRTAMSKWVEQPWIKDSGWDAQWEDICETEVERWDK